MSDEQKKTLYKIIIAGIMFFALLILENTVLKDLFETRWWVGLILYLIPYLLVGGEVVEGAFKNIIRGQVFDEEFLMMVATIGAFGIREYSEACAVMLFYQVGELFQDIAVGKSRQSIAELMEICPDYANIEVDGEIRTVDPDDVEIGSIIIVKPGEKVPLDGVVVEGESMLDTSALTGEPVPRRATPGEEVISGCVNGANLLKIRTTKAFEDSTVSRILDLVENASSKKSPMENFIDRFARVYTPVVTISAVILALLPPLILGGGWTDWIQRACVFLVISCPCALVISVPLGFFGGIGASSKIGVLVKGSNFLEAAGEMTTLVMDKTGTLTKGEFKVSEIRPGKEFFKDINEEEAKEKLLEMAAMAEQFSTHPIAESIRAAYGKETDASRITEIEEAAGHGVSCKVDGRPVLAGNTRLLESKGIACEEVQSAGTVVYLACDGIFAGSIVISDSIKEGVADAIREIKEAGVTKTVMLTGDRKASAETVASQVGIDKVFSELLPQGKVEAVEELMTELTGKEKLGFVGDGINDAPVLTRSDVGIAMGSMGSDAAIEAADIVIMDDDIRKIPAVIRIARKTVRIVKQNIILALSVKAIVLILGALGAANMWLAVFADVGVAVIAILNSMRALKLR